MSLSLLLSLSNLSQHKPERLSSRRDACDSTHCPLLCPSCTPCHESKAQQFEQILSLGVVTPSLMSAGPGCLTDVGRPFLSDDGSDPSTFDHRANTTVEVEIHD